MYAKTQRTPIWRRLTNRSQQILIKSACTYDEQTLRAPRKTIRYTPRGNPWHTQRVPMNCAPGGHLYYHVLSCSLLFIFIFYYLIFIYYMFHWYLCYGHSYYYLGAFLLLCIVIFITINNKFITVYCRCITIDCHFQYYSCNPYYYLLLLLLLFMFFLLLFIVMFIIIYVSFININCHGHYYSCYYYYYLHFY